MSAWSPGETRRSAESAVWVLEWYRVDQSRTLTNVLVSAAAVLLVGSITVLTTLVFAHDRPLMRLVATTIGAVTTVAGPVIAVLGLQRALGDDAYLALRTDGVVLKRREETTFIPWDELDRAEHEADGDLVVLVSKDESRLLIEDRFVGIARRDMVNRVNDTRRKAVWNLIGI